MVLDEAASGDERAQYSQGEMYSKGKGVAQNFSEAYAWYSIAADNGLVFAKRDKEKIAQKKLIFGFKFL